MTTGIVYHYRAVVSNSFYVLFGVNQSFTTTVFTDINAGLPGVGAGSAAWGDYDSDGRLDILLTGTNVSSGRIAALWRNNGSGFTIIFSGGGYFGAVGNAIAWADFNNDGRLDYLLAGEGISTVYSNTASGFVPLYSPAEYLYTVAVAWGDYNNDGWTDVLLTGLNIFSSEERLQLWRNTGNGFTNLNMGLWGFPVRGSVAWGDYDNDGWLDFVHTGLPTVQPVWRNTGSGFTNLNSGLPAGGVYGDVAWGDYDNDGRLDILITGTTNDVASGAISQVWRNTGAGFSNINAVLPGIYRGSGA